MALYTETVMDHFMHPRNVGEIADADGVGEVGNAKCGDIMKMYLKIKDGKIDDVKFETFGCASAIASSSMATELIKGKTIDEALAVTNKQVVDELDGLAVFIGLFVCKLGQRGAELGKNAVAKLRSLGHIKYGVFE